MATTSEVKEGLDEIAQRIRSSRKGFALAKNAIVQSRDKLIAIPTHYAEVIETINEYSNTDGFGSVAKDELASLTAEYEALRDSIDDIITAAGI